MKQIIVYRIGQACIWVLDGQIFLSKYPPYVDELDCVNESSSDYIRLDRVEAAALSAILTAVTSKKTEPSEEEK